MTMESLVVLQTFTKDLSGPIVDAISNLDDRSTEALGDLKHQFDAAKANITAITDTFESNVQQAISAVDKLTIKLTQCAAEFDSVNETFEKALGKINALLADDLDAFANLATDLLEKGLALEGASVKARSTIADEAKQTLAELDAHQGEIGHMIDGVWKTLEQFSENGADQYKQAENAMTGLENSATSILLQLEQSLEGAGQQAISLLAGEMESLVQTAALQGNQVVDVANMVMDHTGNLGDEFVGSVDQVTQAIDQLVALVNALGPLVDLAEAL